MLRNVWLAAETGVMWAFLWLGLYIVRCDLPIPRRKLDVWHRPPLLAAAAMILASAFFYSVAVQTAITSRTLYILWQKLTWWAVPIAVALWFRVAILIVISLRPHLRPLSHVVTWITLPYAVVLSLAGTFTDFLFRYDDIYPVDTVFSHYVIPPHIPWHHFYGIFVIFTLMLSSLLFFLVYLAEPDLSLRRGYLGLGWGSTFIAVGGTTSIVAYINMNVLPEHVGDIIAGVGLVFVGHSMRTYGVLLKFDRNEFNQTLVTALSRSALFALIALLGSYTLTEEGLQVEFFPLFTVVSIALYFPLAQVRLPDWKVEASLPKAAIATEVNRIFKNKLTKEELATSSLHKLRSSSKVRAAYAKRQGLQLDRLSEEDNVAILKETLVTEVLPYICPQPDRTLENIGEIQPQDHDRWIMATILRTHFIEDRGRRRARKIIEDRLGIVLPDSTYTVWTGRMRKEVIEAIWKAEQKALGQ